MSIINPKRKSEGGNSEPFPKRGKSEFQGGKGNQKGGFGQNGWKPGSNQKGGFNNDGKKKADKAHVNKNAKKKLSAIVTEAKANYQLYTDKKVENSEKEVLKGATYDLVKNNIPELARMKGMGKVIGSLISRKNKTQLVHVQSFYDTLESRLLLLKGNGYRLAIKIIQNSTPKVVQSYVDACLSNGKGLRALFDNFKSARVLCATYACANNAAKRIILQKLVLGSTPLSTADVSTPLQDIFASSKQDVREECSAFLKAILNEKTIQQDLIQDIMLLCIETHQSTGMDIEEFLKLASDNVLPLCRRVSNCTLALWVVWLSNAQMRKQIMKALKGKVVPLLQTYNGRMFMMALFESTDDTKALNKMVMKEFLDSVDNLVQQTEVRKLLEFLMLPRSTKFMHPKDIEILKKGDEIRTSKKSTDVRFNEIRDYMKGPILTALKENCTDWLKDNKLCLFVIAVIERFGDTLPEPVLEEISNTLTAPEFSDRIHEKAIKMLLESLINADVGRFESTAESPRFVNSFIPALGKTHGKTCLEKSPRIVQILLESATKLEKGLSFKVNKSWIGNKTATDAIKRWETQRTTQKNR